MDETLRTLADRAAITDLLHRYARAVDERDWDLFADCFTDNAAIDYTAVGGIQGDLGTIRSWLADVLRHFRLIQHIITNVEIELAGDMATCRSYLLNPMGIAGENGVLTVFLDSAIYRDRLVRTERGWRIASRTIEPTFSTRHHSLLLRTVSPQVS